VAKAINKAMEKEAEDRPASAALNWRQNPPGKTRDSASRLAAQLPRAADAIFSMLCTIVNSCHCAFTLRRPRNVKRLIPLF